MKKHKISIMLTAATLFSCMGSAFGADIDVATDFSENTIILEGQAKPGERITIMAFPDGVTPENYWSKIPAENIKKALATDGERNFDTVVADPGDIVSFTAQFFADEQGTFSYEFALEESGIYDVYLMYSGSSKTIDDIYFADSEDYKTEIDNLNKATEKSDDSGVKEILKNTDKCAVLGFSVVSGADTDDVAKILYNTLQDKDLSADEFKENQKLYKAVVAASLFNDGKDAAVSYLEYVLADSTVTEYFEEYAKEKDIIDLLKEKDIKDLEDLENCVKGALVLLVVEDPNGYENIKKAFTDFKDVVGISSPTSDMEVYRKLTGKSFDSIEELKEAYSNAKTSNSGSNGSSGSGGSGSGSSKKNNGYTFNPGTTDNKVPDGINKNIFDDLDSVPWAKEAIVTLAAKGVINGKSDNVFAPNDYITREEFTKLITAALADDITPADISFADVEPGRWSHTYIAKAKAAGFINGYSDTLFGAQDLITRQDMAKIIYSAAKYKEIKLEDANSVPLFADDDAISDYAKEAVYTLKGMEIINGVDEMCFAPKDNATRAQAAVMLYRLLLK